MDNIENIKNIINNYKELKSLCDSNIDIDQLPPQLRNKIYIMCMRNFWRNYIPLTAKVLPWYQLSVTRNKQLFYAQQNYIKCLEQFYQGLSVMILEE